jgi:hypothetical protein
MSKDFHSGPPLVRFPKDNKGSVVVLCPYGHFISSLPIKEWAGSWLEAKVSDSTWMVDCNGTLPKG